MNNSRISTLSGKKYLYNIVDSILVEVHTEFNHYNLPIETLFLMAARINKKRAFLFVSKLIGKHLPIQPSKGLLTSSLLAARYYESTVGGTCEYRNEWVSNLLLGEPSFTGKSFIPSTINPLVIGFAETATALGHAFFDCFKNADYFHTTREVLQEQNPLITFEEEHSHATSHRCYIPIELIRNEREIILVDDELTTGKTALNIIRSIQERFPRKVYTIVAILDWRSEENKREFTMLENLLGITIRVVSLFSGSVQVNKAKEIARNQENNPNFDGNNPIIEVLHLPADFSEMNVSSVLTNGTLNHAPYLKETGRFGIDSRFNERNQPKWDKIASILKEKRSGEKTLCLGTGEFMYIPMKIAAQMGQGVSYQSTTRSPVFIKDQPLYGARFGIEFPSPEDMGITHFVYNIPPGYYDDLFIFFEREVNEENLQPLIRELKKTQINSIKFVYFIKK